MPAPNNEPVAVRPDRQELERRQRNRLDARVARALACECKLRRDPQIAGLVLREIRNRLRFLATVGLGYITLNRASATLSGGEGQRIRLATQIGSQLRGVLYVLDEPSIGLHPRDNQKLLETLSALRDLGNTVLVVEHDEETIRRADYVVDLGPAAGAHGGEIVAAGTPEEIMSAPSSHTGRFLKAHLARSNGHI